MPERSLPAEARAAVWSIIGTGESPLNRRSSYELIEPIIRKHFSSTDPDRTIASIRGWFEVHADQWRIKPDLRERVAVLILEGIRTERSEIAIWAAGWIDTDRAGSLIRSGWSPNEIDSFVEAALATLEKLCDSDEALDATGIFPELDGTNARMPKSALIRNGRLETFRHLDRNGLEFVSKGLHPAAGRLIELVLALRPEQFKFLVKRLEHPVMQARAARCMLGRALPFDHRATLHWITDDSCEDLIALAIVHTLNTVNRLDEELRSADCAAADRYGWSTELRPPRDDFDTAAAGLLSGLVDRLAVLDPLSCARWIGELLGGAPYMLHGRGVDKNGKPHRIDQLERACTKLLARLAHQSWSDDLLAALGAGLRLTPRPTWTRHLADVAWEIRDLAPARAVEIARATLCEHERHLARESERKRVFLNWSDWHDREWIGGLAIALALSQEEIDLPNWVSSRCQTLPLSAWDAEEDHAAFIAAERVAQHWFLIGFRAIEALKELGRSIDPTAVCTLAEKLWTHCRFAERYLHGGLEASITVEYAARSVAEFGEPSDRWLLDQARHPGVGPRALWALSDQCRRKNARDGGTNAQYKELITAELVRIASDRFSEGTQLDLEALLYWGQLWLLLGAADEAERTAMAIIACPRRKHDRAADILALKLLALAARERRPALAIRDYFALRYRQLWSGYTPDEERTDRQQLDELLERSELGIP